VGVEGYLAGFAAEFVREAEQEGRTLTPDEARRKAMRLLSEMVGALTLARAVRHVEPELSEEILRAGHRQALD
jgi:TetR/AcrR family transcriptional repressor of nem operon